ARLGRSSQILGSNQRNHQIDEKRQGNGSAQHIPPSHFLRSSAAHPATNASVSSKNTAINAKNKISTASPVRTGLGHELWETSKLGARAEKRGSICERRCNSRVNGQ